MKIYGNDARTGKRSSAVQKQYVKQASKPCKLYQDAYAKRLEDARALAKELKNDPNHPLHGAPKTDYIRKPDWCMCEKCEARRELLRSRGRISKKHSSKKGNSASRKKSARDAIYNEFGEVVYSAGGVQTSYKAKSTNSSNKKRQTGKNLSRAIAESTLNRTQLAKESGISMQTLSRMCRRDEYGTLESWLLVCDALGVELSDIVR